MAALLLLLFALGGCSRPILAKPRFAETPAPTPAVTATLAEEAEVAGPAIPALRTIFKGAGVNRTRESVSAQPAAGSVPASPLATPTADQDATDIWDILPTPTPTPLALSGDTISDTAAVSELLALTVPLHSLVLLPTPTPTPQKASSPLPAPTPDGTVRTVRVPILMYHYLSVPPADADIYRLDLSVAPDLFAAHLDAIQSAGYVTVNLYDLIAYLTRGTPLPEKPVIITFDDGYRDVYENAFPLLRERGMTATFFVITDFIDEQRPEYLTWEMAREMLAGGMSIESHGRNHISLQNKDVDYLIWQALGSAETIEFELGRRPRFVSYPAGEYDEATAAVFASAGYWAGVTTVQGATHRSDALFDLTRVRVRGTTTPEELLRLLALDW